MRYRRLPYSIIAIIACLVKCRDKWKATTNPAERAIPQAIWLQLDDANAQSLLSLMLKASRALAACQAIQIECTDALKAAFERLVMFSADFHIVLDRGINRGAFHPGARSYYLRDARATTIPEPRSYDDLKTVARNIIQGEADRAAAEGQGTPLTLDSGLHLDTGLHLDSTTGGYVPMALPSAAEVAAVLAEFETALLASEAAQTEVNRAEEALAAYKPAGLELTRDVYDEVEHFYRKDPDASSRRDKCEPWGLTYTAEGEPPPEEPPAPTPPAK